MKSIFYTKLKTPKKIRLDIDNIILDLEKNGRCVTNNSVAVQSLSRRLSYPKAHGDIIFAKDRYRQRTVIMIHPEKKLVKTGMRIKFVDR
jgi:hypothetical protein